MDGAVVAGGCYRTVNSYGRLAPFPMIKLSHLGGEPFILNADLIQYVETRPDTFITLTTGERLVVAEPMEEVVRRAVAYQQAKHWLPPPAPNP